MPRPSSSLRLGDPAPAFALHDAATDATDGTDGTRLVLLMRASAAGRRSAAEHVVAWLAEQGLRLDVEDPVAALADRAEAVPVRRLPASG